MAWAGSTRRLRLPPDWPKVRAKVLKRDGHRCRIRFADICTGHATCVDHINDDDDHSLEALQAACRPCNERKNIIRRRRREAVERPAERHPGLL